MKNSFVLICIIFFSCQVVAAQQSLDVAYVKNKSGNWQIINKQGQILADTLFEHDTKAQLNCNEGMAITEKNGKYGFLDLFSANSIPNQFDSVSYFRNGKAAVLNNRQWHLVHRDGTIAVNDLTGSDIDFYFIEQAEDSCLNGFCLTETDGFINCKSPDGRLMLSKSDAFVAPWNDVNSFLNNRILKYKLMANKICSCQKATNYYGFIDQQGNWMVAPDFELADIFADGMAAVSEGTEGMYLFGYIDMAGKWMIDPVYKEAGRFRSLQRK